MTDYTEYREVMDIHEMAAKLSNLLGEKHFSDIYLRVKRMVEGSKYPWNDPILVDWDIVGMNHYRGKMGERYLYVAMTRGDFCITAEGKNEEAVWDELRTKAVELHASLTDE